MYYSKIDNRKQQVQYQLDSNVGVETGFEDRLALNNIPLPSSSIPHSPLPGKKKKKSEGLNIEKLLLLWLKKSLILYSWWIFSYQLHRLSGENKNEVAHPCQTLCNPMYSSLPDSSIHGIFHEYWSGWLIPSPGDLPDPGIEPGSPTL